MSQFTIIETFNAVEMLMPDI